MTKENYIKARKIISQSMKEMNAEVDDLEFAHIMEIWKRLFDTRLVTFELEALADDFGSFIEVRLFIPKFNRYIVLNNSFELEDGSETPGHVARYFLETQDEAEQFINSNNLK